MLAFCFFVQLFSVKSIFIEKDFFAFKLRRKLQNNEKKKPQTSKSSKNESWVESKMLRSLSKVCNFDV